VKKEGIAKKGWKRGGKQKGKGWKKEGIGNVCQCSQRVFLFTSYQFALHRFNSILSDE
jgi:hypothetical protein